MAAQKGAGANAGVKGKTGGGGARDGAFDVLAQVEKGAYANLALDHWLEGYGRSLSGEDRALLTELVLGVVKRRLTLDWMIDRLVQKPQRLENGPRILLRLGLYQLSWLDRIPERAAVYETVEIARKRYHSGVASLINGVLRSWIREKDHMAWPDEEKEPVSFLSVCYSFPPWMAERWLNRYGMEHTKAYCGYMNTPPILWLRTNTLRVTPEDLASRLSAQGCRTGYGRYSPEAIALLEGPGVRRLESFHEGLFTVQDESSMLAAHGLSPLPGQCVLDTCAAPGGKTTHLAQLMKDQGRITAWDVHAHRIKLLRETQQRLGIRCISAEVQDAAGAFGDRGTEPVVGEAPGALPGGIHRRQSFDRILVDAPCSGLGVLHRRADARWNRQPGDLSALADVQERILRNALSLLAPDGRLLYCTCTAEPEENRCLVEKVLAAYPGFRKGKLSLPVLREENRSILPDPSSDWDMQFLPFVHGLDGFYMAMIERAN